MMSFVSFGEFWLVLVSFGEFFGEFLVSFGEFW
jgi:hypothetical protein